MPVQFSGVVTEQKGAPAPAPGIPPRLSQEARSRLSVHPTASPPTYQPQSQNNGYVGGAAPPQHSYQPSQTEGGGGAGPPQHSYQPSHAGPPQHSYQASVGIAGGGGGGPPQHAYAAGGGPPQHSYQQPVAQAGPPQHSYKQPQAAAAPPQHAYQPDTGKKAGGPAAARSGTRAGAGTRGVIPESPSRFGYWASNMAIGSAWAAGFLGACSIAWGITKTGYQSSMLELMSGIYGIVLGIAILAYEKYVGIDRTNHWFPARAIGYAALSVFCFYSEPMMIAGVFLACTAIVQLCATFLREEYKGSAEKPAAKKEAIVLEAQTSIKDAFFAYITMLRQQNKVGVVLFVSAFLAANIVIFAYNVNFYTNLINDQRANNPSQYLSGWVPYAKGFGNLLDFNCAFILVPVCRTFLRILYNRSTADQSFFARLLRGILYFIPIDKNIAFHKLIAKFVLMASFGHTVCHFFNYAAAPSLTYATFGLDPWITGGLICLCVLLIFSSAGESVRRGQFEIFWYNHHLFIIFFGLILGHGKGGRNPHFHWWFIGPGALYVLERLLRVYRAHKKVVILSVTMMDDVFSLEFSKEGVFATPFKEGQYIFLNCNAVSMVQWHPFTISSAPQERTVTVHIRVLGPGSWTRGLRDYIGNMGPTSKSFFTFERMEPGGKLQGKICGPDGKRMLAIDGPHSAPTQHIGEYSHVIVIGAGIGVTPVAATLKSVIFHRWKYFVGACFPDHAYFVWVCGHKDIDAFRWLIRYIKDAQDEVTHMSITNPTNMATKTFEFHIFITSVPKDQKPIEVVIDDEIGFWGVPREETGANGIREVEKHRCNWDEADLYRLMMCPPPHTQLNNVHIWEGRPKWDPLFQHVGDRHANVDIGVTFCGNPMIGRDLYRQCYTHSRGRKQGIFKFHKENF